MHICLQKKRDPEKLQADNALIQMGLQRGKKLSEELSNLRKKKKAKTSSNFKYSHSETSPN